MTAQSKPVNPNTFPFWKLPVLARSRVTKLMEQEDVIHLSMHSKLFKRLLKTFKIGGVSITFMFWCNLPESDDFPEECQIIQTCYSPSYDNVSLLCPHPDHRRIPQNEQMLVHNNQMLVGREGKRFEVNSGLTFQEQLTTIEHLTRHLLEIFRVEHFNLDYNHTKQNHIFGSFVWDIVDKFRSISILPYNVPLREDSFDEEEEKERINNLYGLSHEQTKFLFNEVKTDKLDFQGYISNPEKLTGIQLKHRKVQFWDEDSLGWLTMDHAIDSGSEELRIFFKEVEVVKVVELLEKWQSGEKLVNLKRLDLSYVEKDEHQQLIEKLGELKGVKMYSRKEAEEFLKKIGESKVEVGPFFVQRTTDGKVARFYIHYGTVHFLCD